MMSPKRIQALPIQLANQIAAGEVVERPASVLKELLENSLDAGATDVDIRIEHGGIGCIRVQDNGIGICKEDLELAIAPHATSKIQTLLDLEEVVSYGFRGEALASIGAVSRLELTSCMEGQTLGWSLRREGRQALPVLKPVSRLQGTCVEVRDLFYNTPGRRKFLRSEKTESQHLEETFKRIALSQPSVAFSFYQSDRLQKRLPACRDLEAHARRVAMLCGPRFMNDAYYVEADNNGLKLSGWLGSPKSLRSQPDLQYFYVNGRIVRDKVVNHAVRQAYQKYCLPGFYPGYLLYFELDPTAVDVNVHPTKHEVRFRESRTVHAFLSYSIEAGLEQTKIETLPKVELLKKEATEVRFSEKKIEIGKKDKEEEDSIIEISVPEKLLGKPLSIFAKEFLLAENDEGLLIVDIKATQYAILNDLFQEAFNQSSVEMRPMLIPKSVQVGKSADALDATSLDWQRLGFDLSQSGPDSVLVRAVPSLFGASLEKLEVLIQKLLRVVHSEEAIQCIVQHMVDGQSFSIEQGESLLQSLQNQDNNNLKLYRQITPEQLRAALFR